MTRSPAAPKPGPSGQSDPLDPAELGTLIATGRRGQNDASGRPVLTRGELFARVKPRAEGLRGREIRQVIDAVLDELGAALVAGEALKLPPLGTVKIQRHNIAADADLVICKLRRKKPPRQANHPLADPAKES